MLFIFNLKSYWRALKSKNEFYTFKLSDHERIFVKRLDDNKIFYNNFIYDKDFFFYEQLIKLIIHINKCRDDFIKESFKRYTDYNIYSNAKGIRLLKVISFGLDYNNECQNLTKEQYDILVKAYNYEFYYEHLYDFFHPWKEIPRATHLKDLLEDWLYINGWKSIKPVYPIFQPALYKYYNSNRKDKVYFSEPTLKDPAVKYGFTMMPNPNYLNKDNCSLAWDEELKFYRTFNWSEEFHKYENSKENKEFSFITDESTKVFDVYNPVYNPLNEGTDIREEWLDYDEKKKFEEFDINCKTNTYNARYKYYNEVACSEYSEDKKYKTTPIHDFTEEEIKENYENMMDKTKTALDRWLFAGKYKNLKHLVHFLRLIEYIDLKLCRINRGYTRLKGELTRTHFDNQNTLFMRGFEEEGEHEVSREYGERDLWTMEEGPGKQIHELLTNPQYILIMPLLDVLFEVWRETGYWKGDGTLMGVDISKTVFTMQDDRIGRSFALYERTLEYQHYQIVNDCWGITDYMDEIDEDLDEDLDNIVMRYPMIPSIIFYFFFLPFIMIYGLYYGPGLDVPLQSLVVNGQYHLAWYDYLNIRRPSIYFELELKAPRNFLPYGTRIRRLRVRERIPHYKYRPFRPKHWLSKETNILGYSFLEQSKVNYYSVFTENRRVFKPFNIGWRLWYFLDSRDDDLFLPIHDYIVWFGRKTAISIYHVDGTLRVRWWTKLAAWIQDYLERQVNRFLNWIAPLQETVNLSDFDEVKAGKSVVEFIEEQDVIFVEERKKYKESAFYLFLTIFFIWFIIMFLLWWFV